MARLIVIDGPDLGAEYKLEPLSNDSARETIIGRDPGVDIPLNDTAISCLLYTSPSPPDLQEWL